jgi:hypothetical protein
MAEKRQMNEVRLRVRESALILQEFTVDQIIKATGLNPDSVRTELRRMKAEKFLTSESLSGRQQGPGGPPSVYRLTPDPEKRLALSRQVRAFYPTFPEPTRPTSPHYLIASQLLGQIVEGDYKNDTERVALLNKANESLEFAWYDEGEPEGLVNAFIQYQKARLKYAVGEYDRAEEIFKNCKAAFVTAELPDDIARTEEYMTCISIQRQLKQMLPYSALQEATVILKTVQPTKGTLSEDRPLQGLLIKSLKTLASPTRQQVYKKALEPVVAYTSQYAYDRGFKEINAGSLFHYYEDEGYRDVETIPSIDEIGMIYAMTGQIWSHNDIGPINRQRKSKIVQEKKRREAPSLSILALSKVSNYSWEK